MFKPKVEKDPRTNRKETTVTAIIGEDRKKRFVEYCKKHKISQTECLKQMIDHCIGEEEDIQVIPEPPEPPQSIVGKESEIG